MSGIAGAPASATQIVSPRPLKRVIVLDPAPVYTAPRQDPTITDRESGDSFRGAVGAVDAASCGAPYPGSSVESTSSTTAEASGVYVLAITTTAIRCAGTV